MTLAITTVSALLVLGMGVAGYQRDLARSITAILGTLLGVVMVSFWAEQLARELGQRSGVTDLPALGRFASIAIFGLTALLVGYGGGVLLPRGYPTRPLPLRLLCALLGLLNGAVIAGYTLRFAAQGNPAFRASLGASPLGQALYERLPALVLGATLAVAGLVLARVALRALGAPGADLPVGARPASSFASGSARELDQRTIEKIRERIG